MSNVLVTILADSYTLPNKGHYSIGQVVDLTPAQFAAIPPDDLGSKVEQVDTVVDTTSLCLVKIGADGYALANGGRYDSGDVVALSGKQYFAVPESARASTVALRSQPPLFAHDVTVNTGSSVRSVPRSFLGIGMETWDIYRFSGSPFVVNALAALNVDGNNTPTLRLGGGSADGTWWNPDGLPKPAGISDDYNAAFLAAVNRYLADTGAKIILALNMGYGDTAVTVGWLNAALANIAHGRIVSFQIGNEPDVYPGVRRPAGYSLDDYIAELPTFVAAVDPILTPTGIPLSLPAFSSFTWFDPSKFAAIDAAGGSNFKVWDQHRYTSISSANPTIADILDPARRSYMNGNYSSIVGHADSVGKTVRASELNTVGQGGVYGVSDSQAGALWLLRAMLDLSQIGVAAVNVHGMRERSYSPIVPNAAATQWKIQSTYYAMRLFALAAQHDATFMSLTATGIPASLALYGLRGADGVYRLVAINVDASSSQAVSFALPTAPTGSLTTLTAPALTSTAGITLAGQTYDGSPDGNPLGVAQRPTVAPVAGRYRIVVPPASAVLLEV